MTVTVDCGAYDVQAYRVEVYDYTSYDTDTPVGGTASGTDADGNGALQITLSAAPLASSHILATVTVGITSDGTYACTPGTSWTELFDQRIQQFWFGGQTQTINNVTGTAVDWNDIQAGTAGVESGVALALEIRDVSAGGGAAYNPIPTIYKYALNRRGGIFRN